MKRLLTVFVILLVCNVLMAGGVNKKTAQQKAAAFLGKSTPMKLVAVDREDEPSYYVFNVQRESRDFVIVSGEESGDGILGYSDTGTFNSQDMPPALQYMLDCYSQQMALVRSGQAERYQNLTANEEITPLLTTSWDQNPPYNLYNPTNPYTEERFPYCGCVATAMAQIVKYWASPVPVQEIPGYHYYLSTDGNNYSTSSISTYPYFGVAGLPSTTFDFGIMEDEYATDAEGQSIDEVARLLAYCGRAVEMKYTNSSGAGSTTAEAFSKYFGYNPNATSVNRSDYSAAEWDQLIYDDLKMKRPVIYLGRAVSTSGTTGHAFICDGYKDGMYHINWGWSGRYNGYFKLSECNPYGTGSGGSSSKDGYSVSQSALIGIQPDATEPMAEKVWMKTEYISSSPDPHTRGDVSESFELSINFGVFNAASAEHTFDIGIGIYDSNRNLISTGIYLKDKTYKPNYGLRTNYTFNWGNNMPDGTYYLRNLSRESGTTAWVPNKYSDTRYLVLNVSQNTLTVTEPEATLSVSNITIEGMQKEGKTITLKPVVTNNGFSNSSVLYLFIDGKLATGAGVNIDPKKTEEVLLHFVAPEAGNHTLAIYQDIDSSRKPVGDALWSGSIDIAVSNDPNLTASNCNIKNMNKTDRTIKGNSFIMSIPVTNESSEDFDDEIIFRLYKLYDPEASMGRMDAEQRIPCTIPSGSTQTVQVSFGGLSAGKVYWINTYYYKPSEKTNYNFYKTRSYEMLGNSAAIDKVSANQPDDNAPCYSLNGQRIKLPVKGIYIKGGKKFVVK